jgi:AraC-like DNA-binding protein
MEKCERSGESVVYECHAGFIDIIVPLFVNKRFIGCLTAGQILNEEPTAKSFKEFRSRTKYLEIDEKALRDYYFATKVLSPDEVEALVELLTLIGNYIVESESKLLFLESITEKGRVPEARKFIEKNYRKKITVLDIARAVYQSESYFSHQFKKETGVSPIKYLNEFRVDKAKELLNNLELSVGEVAFNTGFNNLTHFNRIFKALTSQSPSEYRKSGNGKI